ncbi:sulfotransferase family 2 domain-containing protein [Salipiger abyssi]|uniref:sulfotransferase family 2 domain-containing protein n=1 Tax=Salipiger abyssi TaxID=1250539 RepID=UPI004058A109
MVRQFKYAKSTHAPLSKNALHKFAAKHAIGLFNIASVYTYIPKNVCSTFRYSAAISNGVLREGDDPNWIHKNNETFNPTLEYLVTAAYTFTVLRCPYRRIASAFLNKVVDTEIGPKYTLPISFAGRVKRKVVKDEYYKDLSFKEFCKILKGLEHAEFEKHWRPQTYFLLYEDYDDYFCVEDLGTAVAKLAEVGFAVHDTRKHLKHDTSHYEKAGGAFSETNVGEIREMKAGGSLPTYESLFDDETKALIDGIYKDDLDLYDAHFAPDLKLFH